MPPKMSTIHKTIKANRAILRDGSLVHRIDSLERRIKHLEKDNLAKQNELIKLTDPDVIDTIKSSPSKDVIDALYDYQEVEDKDGSK